MYTTLSNAFLKSIKFISRHVWYSTHCSVMFLSMNICLVHDLPLLNPACSYHSRMSTACFSQLRSTMQKALPGINNSGIPLQLLQSVRSPFLASFMMTSLCHSSGTFSSPITVLNKSLSAFQIMFLPHLSNSAGISSTPVALLFFNCLIALSTSSLVIGLIVMSCSCIVGSILKSNIELECGWLGTLLKCSTHLAFYSSSVIKILPFLSFTGIHPVAGDLVRTLTLFYSVLLSFWTIASCALFLFPCPFLFISYTAPLNCSVQLPIFPICTLT